MANWYWQNSCNPESWPAALQFIDETQIDQSHNSETQIDMKLQLVWSYKNMKMIGRATGNDQCAGNAADDDET